MTPQDRALLEAYANKKLNDWVVYGTVSTVLLTIWIGSAMSSWVFGEVFQYHWWTIPMGITIFLLAAGVSAFLTAGFVIIFILIAWRRRERFK